MGGQNDQLARNLQLIYTDTPVLQKSQSTDVCGRTTDLSQSYVENPFANVLILEIVKINCKEMFVTCIT